MGWPVAMSMEIALTDFVDVEKIHPEQGEHFLEASQIKKKDVEEGNT